jgi:hypothetical protein
VQQFGQRGRFRGTMPDARASRRYLLKELLTFSCADGKADSAGMLGRTENVSASGILFVTVADVQVGAGISLNLHLRSHRVPEKLITLHAEGTVVRVDSAGKRNLVAAEIHFRDDIEEEFSLTHTIQ